MQTVSRLIFPSLKAALPDKRAVVITGMRRVGKTTSLHWLLDQVVSPNKIYLDLERLDQRKVFQESNYDLVISFLRNHGLDTSQPMIVALDEIQYVQNMPSVIKYLSDNYSIKFLLTGSSSFYLKNYFTESLAGRKVVFEMFPLKPLANFLIFAKFLIKNEKVFQKCNLTHTNLSASKVIMKITYYTVGYRALF